MNSNLIFIVGYSSSGKTTTARIISRELGAMHISLDSFEHHSFIIGKKRESMGGFNEMVWDYFNIVRPDLKEETFKGYSSEEFLKEFNQFFDWVMTSMSKNKIYVIEGVQIFGYVDPELILNNRVIIKGTSLVTSFIRDKKRAGHNIISAVKEELNKDQQRRSTFLRHHEGFVKFKSVLKKGDDFYE